MDAVKAAYRQGDLVAAEKAARTLKNNTDDTKLKNEALHVLAGIIWQQRRAHSECISLLQQITADPPNKSVRLLAEIYRDRGSYADALRTLQKAQNWKEEPEILLIMSKIYRRQEDGNNQIAMLEQYVKLKPSESFGHYKLGCAFRRVGKIDECVPHFRKAIAIDGHALARFKLASVTGENQDEFKIAPAKYVAELFDTYAETFDKHLVEQLHYRTPSVLLEQCLGYAHKAPRKMTVTWDRCADLGCGTGLAGELFQTHVNYLYGVDLSPKMIEKAKKKGCYSSLEVGSIQDCLATCLKDGQTFDIIIAADVLVYFGALEEVFELAQKLLTKGGLLAFSLEKLDDTKVEAAKDFQLTDTGRYVHSTAYLQRLGSSFGPLCGPVVQHEMVLRENAGEPVHGTIYLFEKQAEKQ
eukprot:TRINITY_DN66428_c2_g1_i1.p1 TRINITY_DN66428_c2_g1~~TRINITY_DN66428_c2_g1_i1.p1  ORF type:complete len:412 (+),score=34.58 TRINITY_DN66428_c2_g1_i1:2-1237(+)